MFLLLRLLFIVSFCLTVQPYDFELTFADRQVYVEVKSTVKRDKAFIHLSANKLDFALKECERYHVFRVYSASHGHNVRLCRIRNLVQTLHAKVLELFLLVCHATIGPKQAPPLHPPW